MKLKIILFIALVLIAVSAPVLHIAGAASGAGIERPTCELIGPGLYRIDYQASPDAGSVEVFVSSRPDRIDSAKPALTIRQPPAEVSVAGRSGRVYFHLKPASGATRVVALRRLPLEGATNFRDLGGYPTTDGLYVRWGMVYRSGDLVNLTARDYQYLDGLGIRLVCDVRTPGERKRSPTHWMGHMPEFLSTPIGRERDIALVAEEVQRERSSPDAGSKEAPPKSDQYAIEYVQQYGHEHTYQRTRPFRFTPTEMSKAATVNEKDRRVEGRFRVDEKFDGQARTKPDGIIYITTGAGGKHLYDGDFTDAPSKWRRKDDKDVAYVARFISDRHSLSIFDVDGQRLQMRQIDEYGQEIDRIRVTK